MKTISNLLVLLCCALFSNAQRNSADSAYYLLIGEKLKFPLNDTKENWVATKTDKQPLKVYLKTPFRIDTVMNINPITLEEQQVILPHHSFMVKNDWGDIDYNSFIQQTRSGFVIEQGSHRWPLTALHLYYEVGIWGEWLTLKYPKPDPATIEKLEALRSGGFIVISGAEVADNPTPEPLWLLSYLSINNPHLRPEKNTSQDTLETVEVIKTLPAIPAPSSSHPATGSFLYRGIENPIRVSFAGDVSKRIRARVEGDATVIQKKDEPDIFIITPGRARECTIHFEKYDAGKYVEVASQTFRIQSVPKPSLSVNGKFFGGYIAANNLREFTGLVALVEGFDGPILFDVSEFEMVYSSKGKVSSAKATGPMFTPEMLGWLHHAVVNDIFLIQGTSAIGKDSWPRLLPQLAFVIKE